MHTHAMMISNPFQAMTDIDGFRSATASRCHEGMAKMVPFEWSNYRRLTCFCMFHAVCLNLSYHCPACSLPHPVILPNSA